MGLRDHLRRLVDRRLRSARRTKDAKRNKFLPRVEALEIRAMMATVPGTWQLLNTVNPASAPPQGTQSFALLSDGTVMEAGFTNPGNATGSTDWFTLKPDNNGNYITGSWGASSRMNTSRLFFPSLTLPDGRVFAIGGEYGNPFGFVNSPEIYDPLTNRWTPVAPMPSPPTQAAIFPSVPPNSPTSQFGDDPIALLPNGDILAGWFNGPQTFVYNVASNTWRQTSNDKLRNDASDEESWMKLPDDSILSYDIFASDTSQIFHAQRYVPSLDMWLDASNVDPANPPLVMTSGLTGFELGPGHLLPDGRAFFAGANGHTAYYDPKIDLWSRGPELPQVNFFGIPLQSGATDNPAAVLPNGHVLMALSPAQPLFFPPTAIYEFDPIASTFTDVTPTGVNQFLNAFEFTMLMLPTGQVLLGNQNQGNSTTFPNGMNLVYTPVGGPKDSWRPTISSLRDNHNGTFTLTGTQLNGLSEGASYGDDAEMSTNYPLLRMTDKVTGDTVYARTFNWSSNGVQTGSKIVSTQFTLPVGKRLTDFTNYTVIASGIASFPFQYFPTAPQNISGIKFNDFNGDGIRQANEPGISHVVVFADVNNDGKLSITEPAAVTDNFGHYTIKSVKPGDYVVRELPQPGGTQTMPGPLGIDLAGLTPVANAYTVTVLDRPITGLDFGNTVSNDFGDAPDTYGTTLAANGARAGILPGFHLGVLEDAEPDGQPSVTATGDDTVDATTGAVDDEDGVIFVNGMTPGGTAIIQVAVSTGGFSSGKLQGWVDFNQNGRFDATEKVISNVILGPGPHTLSFQVPVTARVNNTYARFRYGYETDLGPTGPSIAGEVEDYQVPVLPSKPIAVPDEFGLPPNLIKQGSRNVVLDVLANDIRTARGAPTIVESDFPQTLPSGSTVTVGPFDPTLGRKVLLYTPSTTEPAPFDETFTYRVTDGFAISDPGTVLVHVSIGNPTALDDTFTFDASDPLIDDPSNGIRAVLSVMDNDHFAVGTTHISDVVNITSGGQTQMTVDPADSTKLDFSASSTFRGTEVFQYTIADNDPNTTDATAFVTVQVVDGGIGATSAQLSAASYLAELDVQLISPITGQPTNQLIIDQGDTFTVRVISHDLRPGRGLNANNIQTGGVEAAYLDLLLPLLQLSNGSKVDYAQPISITYDPLYNIANQFGQIDHPAAGEIDEAGGTHNSTGGGVGTGNVTVFNVTMRAVHATGGTPVNIVGDPADGVLIQSDPPEFNSSITDVLVMGDQLSGEPESVVAFHELDDDPLDPQVLRTFYRQSGELTILGAGEGEFVNHGNRFDVNQDNRVTPLDAMIVINNLNSDGPRLLVSGADSSLFPGTMIDVNMDGRLSPGDALTVINYLNSAASFFASHMPSGEGESSSTTGGMPQATTSDGVTPLDPVQTPATGGTSTSQTSQAAVLLTTTSPPATSGGSTIDPAAGSTASADGQPSSTPVDSSAADDLFAELAAAREQLHRRFSRRR